MISHLDVLPGARVAVVQCLAVRPDDRVLIFTDQETLQIGEALRQAAQEQGAETNCILLEDFGARPHTSIPQSLDRVVHQFHPTVTFYAAQGLPGEIRFRIPLIEMLQRDFRVRHAHMIGITPLLMQSGMLADYQRVAKRTLQVYELVKHACHFLVTNESGTRFEAHLDPERLRWHPWTGLYHKPGQWGNLPEGEVFTSPADCQGVLTVSVLGDYFSEKYGLIDPPVVLRVEQSQLVSVEHPNRSLAQDIWDYLRSAENGRRVGEFAIGTNEALQKPIGNLLQDEKLPGVHVAFGNPYCDFTGATWTCPIHVDVIPLQANVWVDGRLVIQEGKFL